MTIKRMCDNVNTPRYWNKLWGTHGGGERDDDERFNPVVALVTKGSALDVGCGFGHLCNRLRLNGCSPVYGVDFSVEAVKRARENYPSCHFKRGFAEHVPFPIDMFDVVTLAEVLEHLKDYGEGLQEAERVAKSGAIIIFTVPNKSTHHEHVWWFDWKGVDSLLQNKRKSGMEAIGTRWILGWYLND